MAEHSRETISMEQFTNDYSIPQWQARRLAVSMSHKEDFEIKILLG